MSLYYNRILVIGDNKLMLEGVYRVLSGKRLAEKVSIDFACTSGFEVASELVMNIKQINIHESIDRIIENHDLIISAHCRQVFPKALVRAVKCINIHPGFNPYNRGWFPHVFSIINNLPAGATIHEMDEYIDNGPIIMQKEESVYEWDTSETLYSRILCLELELFKNVIDTIVSGTYTTFKSGIKGNINYKKDYEKLKEIDLKKTYKGEEIINLLRALSHGDYNNVYYFKGNDKLNIKLIIERGTRNESI